MKKATVVLVAAMILLAGCSGGGGTATPTDTETGNGDGTTTPGSADGTDSQPSAQEALSDLNSSSSSQPFANATEIEMTLFNGSDNVSLLIQNDSAAGTELIRLSSPSGGTQTFYNTTDYAALRNTTSGEVRYSEPGGNLGFGVAFASAFLLFGGLSYVGVVEWQQGGTTSIDGGSGFVYEADSLNETALSDQQNTDLGFQQGQVQSVDGRMVVSSEGRIQSITVEIETPDGTYGTDIALSYDPVTIQKPDWVDESQAPQ